MKQPRDTQVVRRNTDDLLSVPAVKGSEDWHTKYAYYAHSINQLILEPGSSPSTVD